MPADASMTNKTIVWDMNEMDEKYYVSEIENRECYKIKHNNLNCHLLHEITNSNFIYISYLFSA